MKNKKIKKIIAWIILIVSSCLILTLTYFKFFPDNNNIEEKSINESSSNAIHKALLNIVNNFNQNPSVEKYKVEENITLTATVNNYSIFISYTEAEITTTYEFLYDNLYLNINIKNTEEEKEKFQVVYKILIESVQERINNTNDLEDIVNDFFTTDTNYEGLTKQNVDNVIKYQMNITKKLM